MKNNIDEDIKIVEGIKENCIGASRCSLASGSESNKWEREAKAIENILLELKELRKYDVRKIELKNGMIEKAPSFTKREIELMNLGISLNETTEKSELETYKKIAEKLADLLLKGDEVPYICDIVFDEHCNTYKTGECNKCIIDWARKEVEKNV